MSDAGAKRFASTQWSLVRTAGRSDTQSGRQALAELFRRYWYPLYFFLRRKGLDASDAEDTLQSFFVHMIESDLLDVAEPERGRFRTFLLSSLQNLLAKQRRAGRAIKRGGQATVLSLDFETGRERYEREPVDHLSPEQAFERQWAWTMIERAMERLEQEWATGDRIPVFEALRPMLTGQPTAETYREIASRLGKTETAIKVTMHRLRARCGELIREEIAATVAENSEIDDELGRLFEVMG